MVKVMPRNLNDYYNSHRPPVSKGVNMIKPTLQPLEQKPLFDEGSSNLLVAEVVLVCLIVIGLAIWKIVDIIKWYAN